MQTIKNRGLIIIVALTSLLLSCAGGAGDGDLSDAELFAEGFSAWFFGSIQIGVDDEYIDETTDFSGIVEEIDHTGTGTITYENTYSAPTSTSTFIADFNNFNPDPGQFSSALSGTLTTVTDTTDDSSSTTGTLYYAGDPMVFDISNDSAGNSSGTITYRGTAYPVE